MSLYAPYCVVYMIQGFSLEYNRRFIWRVAFLTLAHICQQVALKVYKTNQHHTQLLNELSSSLTLCRFNTDFDTSTKMKNFFSSNEWVVSLWWIAAAFSIIRCCSIFLHFSTQNNESSGFYWCCMYMSDTSCASYGSFAADESGGSTVAASWFESPSECLHVLPESL